jgi:hypothetical protein
VRCLLEHRRIYELYHGGIISHDEINWSVSKRQVNLPSDGVPLLVSHLIGAIPPKSARLPRFNVLTMLSAWMISGFSTEHDNQEKETCYVKVLFLARFFGEIRILQLAGCDLSQYTE